jgi:hypothetical protein
MQKSVLPSLRMRRRAIKMGIESQLRPSSLAQGEAQAMVKAGRLGVALMKHMLELSRDRLRRSWRPDQINDGR